MAINFWCAECGNPLEADDADAGRDVECGRCGAVVGVPRNPGHFAVRADADPDDLPQPSAVFAAPDAGSGVRGLSLLVASLLTTLTAYLIASAVVFYRASWDGLDKVLQNDSGTSGSLMVRASGLFIALTVLAAVLRVMGYLRCRPVGRLIGTDSALVAAAAGAVAFTVGQILTSVPDLLANDPRRYDPAVRAVTFAGNGLILVGVLAEFGALYFFRGVLAETLGLLAARRVFHYLITFGVMVALGVAAYCWLGIIQAAAPITPGGPATPALVPPAVRAAAVTAAVYLLVATVVLSTQYFLILSRCRAGLTAAARPVREPEP